MIKILVATDFSSTSRKGIRFAMQLASQIECELIFYHVVEIFKPSIWDMAYYNQYEANELYESQKILEQFIQTIYQKSKIQKKTYKCVCQVSTSFGNQIIEFANGINVDYLCVSTIGSGKLIQIFGTTASELIKNCAIPIFIIPKNYKRKPLNEICFASDLVNFKEELNQVKQLTNLLKAKLNVLHFDYSVQLKTKHNIINKLHSKYETNYIKFHFIAQNALYPLHENIQKYIFKSKPSLLVTFTKQNRNWFHSAFIASKTADMAYNSTIPMLVFKKKLRKTSKKM
jgi:nucleotide-binding universal stress UspA family protein